MATALVTLLPKWMNCSWCSQKGYRHTSRTEPGQAVVFSDTCFRRHTERASLFTLPQEVLFFFSPPSTVSTLKLSISSPHPSAASVILSRGFCSLTFWHSYSQQARKLDCKLHEVTNAYFLFGHQTPEKFEVRKKACRASHTLPTWCRVWRAGSR